MTEIMNCRIFYIAVDPDRAEGWYWHELPAGELYGPYHSAILAEFAAKEAASDDKKEREP